MRTSTSVIGRIARALRGGAPATILLASALAWWLVPSSLLCASASAQALSAAPAFRVVVHPDQPASRLEADFVAAAFLRKTTRWPNGQPIRPVDQDASSAVRRKFSSDVLHRSVAAVRNYWQQLIFTGRGLPPPELNNDQEVLKYVARNAGAIGYVSGNCEASGVKVVTLD